jgi:outer membrane protein assembly factor BamB
VWTKDLGAGAYPSQPIVADGRVFAVTEGALLKVLDLRNGALLHERALGVFRGTATYDGGRVYVTDDDGYTTAIDAASGTTLWNAFSGESGPAVATGGKVYIGSSYAVSEFDGATGEARYTSFQGRSAEALPTVDENRVYFSTECGGTIAFNRATLGFAWQGQDGHCTSTGANAPTALFGGRLYNPNPFRQDGTTGTIHDAATGTVFSSYAPAGPPAFDGDLLIRLENAALVARDRSSLQEVWRFTGNGKLDADPIAAGGRVYAGSSAGGLFVLDARTGAQLWQGAATLSAGRLALAQDTLVVSSGSKLIGFRAAAAPPQVGLPDRTVAPVDVGPPAPSPGATTHLYVGADHTSAINLADPRPPLKRRWETTVPTTTALVAAGKVFAIEYGKVTARDPRTGAQLWSTDPIGASIRGAAYDSGRIYLMTSGGIAALDAGTGAELWSRASDDGFVFGAPTAVDGDVYISRGLGTSRYRGATGELVWSARNESQYTDRAPIVDGDRVYAGNVCGPISRTTGEAVPGYAGCATSDHAATPFAAGHLIAGFGRSFYGQFDVDVARGVRDAAFQSGTPPAVIGNVAITTFENRLSAWEFPAWAPRWKESIQSPYDLAMPPLIVGRTVYAVSAAPNIRALDVATGQRVWGEPLGWISLDEYDPGSSAALAVGEGLLLLPTGSGLIAYESA